MYVYHRIYNALRFSFCSFVSVSGSVCPPLLVLLFLFLHCARFLDGSCDTFESFGMGKLWDLYGKIICFGPGLRVANFSGRGLLIGSLPGPGLLFARFPAQACLSQVFSWPRPAFHKFVQSRIAYASFSSPGMSFDFFLAQSCLSQVLTSLAFISPGRPFAMLVWENYEKTMRSNPMPRVGPGLP